MLSDARMPCWAAADGLVLAIGGVESGACLSSALETAVVTAVGDIPRRAVRLCMWRRGRAGGRGERVEDTLLRRARHGGAHRGYGLLAGGGSVTGV